MLNNTRYCNNAINYDEDLFSYDSYLGFFNGTVSSFLHWSQVLTDTEIQGLGDFYRNMIDYSNTEPTLSVVEMRSFFPQAFQHCITSPTTLSDLYEDLPQCSASVNNNFPFYIDF